VLANVGHQGPRLDRLCWKKQGLLDGDLFRSEHGPGAQAPFRRKTRRVTCVVCQVPAGGVWITWGWRLPRRTPGPLRRDGRYLCRGTAGINRGKMYCRASAEWLASSRPAARSAVGRFGRRFGCPSGVLWKIVFFEGVESPNEFSGGAPIRTSSSAPAVGRERGPRVMLRRAVAFREETTIGGSQRVISAFKGGPSTGQSKKTSVWRKSTGQGDGGAGDRTRHVFRSEPLLIRVHKGRTHVAYRSGTPRVPSDAGRQSELLFTTAAWLCLVCCFGFWFGWVGFFFLLLLWFFCTSPSSTPRPCDLLRRRRRYHGRVLEYKWENGY